MTTTPTETPRSPVPVSLKGPVNTPDLVATVLLFAILVPLALLAAFFSLWIGMGMDSCDATCNEDLISRGVEVGVLLPVVGPLAAVGVAAFRLHRRKVAWWVPLVAYLTLLGPFIGSDIASRAY